MAKKGSPADCENEVFLRAIRLVRIHVAGRKPIADREKRHAMHVKRDKAFDRLVAAVETYDKAWAAHEARMAAYYKRRNAALLGMQRRKEKDHV